MKNIVRVTRARRGLGHPEAYLLVRRAVCAALEAEGIPAACEVDVLLTDDAEIRDINRSARNVDAATDVLSFPMNELKPGKFELSACERDPGTGVVALGDMVISVPRCADQASVYGHGFDREVCYLAVHSVLHLLGYDHMDEGPQKKLMRAREEAVMEKLGLPE